MKPEAFGPTYQNLAGVEVACSFAGCGRRFKRLRSTTRDDCKAYCSTTCANNDRNKGTKK